MMERKYQLVAWTENSADTEKARLYLLPSLESEVKASLINDLKAIHQEEYRSNGFISLDFAQRGIRAYENMARFEILTGNFGTGIRYLFFAARFCNGKLRHEFIRLCKEALRLAKKYRREDVLNERTPKMVLDIYYDQVAA